MIRLSIVIAAWNGAASLERCLRSLRDRDEDTEVIVAANFDAPEVPGTQLIRMPSGTSVPELRTAGILRAQGELVALTEDLCELGDAWIRVIRKAHEGPCAAIGGPVESAVERDLDWAVYFYDYNRFMPPLRAGPADSLCGCNVSYKRAALMAAQAGFQDGLFEPFTHAEIVKNGGQLCLAPEMIVHYVKRDTPKQAIAQAYSAARSYAARRPVGSRALYAAGALVLPVLLPARVIARTVGKPRRLGTLARSLGWLLLLTTAWSWGEFRGYLR